jgi:hypothetical protein
MTFAAPAPRARFDTPVAKEHSVGLAGPGVVGLPLTGAFNVW